jgi:carbonic anhydrase/acetyltransferase-like protein (isoleucine patch superfamily)
MAIENFAEFSPQIHESAFIAASADVIGRVTLHEESSIFYQATLRGDINDIVIGPRSNIQDNAVVHLADNYGCYVGELVTVGHSAILHACTVKNEVLVGMGAIVLDGAEITPFLPSPIPSRAHSSAPRKKQIPSNSSPITSPARPRSPPKKKILSSQ